MRKVSRVVIGFFALFTISPGSFGGESLSPSTMLGTWELVEWVHEGQKLKPPQVQARISIQNGVSIAPDCIIGAGALLRNGTHPGEVYPGHHCTPSEKTGEMIKSFK